jgi:hypothetical protein
VELVGQYSQRPKQHLFRRNKLSKTTNQLRKHVAAGVCGSPSAPMVTYIMESYTAGAKEEFRNTRCGGGGANDGEVGGDWEEELSSEGGYNWAAQGGWSTCVAVKEFERREEYWKQKGLVNTEFKYVFLGKLTDESWADMDWFGEQGQQRRLADMKEQIELRRNICGDGFNTDCFGALQYNFESIALQSSFKI